MTTPKKSSSPQARRAKARRQAHKAHGRCTRCGRNPALAGKTKCEPCQAASNLARDLKAVKVQFEGNVQKLAELMSKSTETVRLAIQTELQRVAHELLAKARGMESLSPEEPREDKQQ